MIEDLENMTPEQERAFWKSFVKKLSHDNGAAARAHIAAGHPIYYRERTTPTGTVVKEYPDGHRELVTFDLTGEHFITAIELRANRY